MFRFIWFILLIAVFFFAAWGTGVLRYFFKVIE